MQSTQTEAVLIRRAGSLDSQLLVLVVALSAAGFVMMGSASMDYAAEQYGDPFYHIVRHAIYLVLGTGALWLTLQLPVRLWEHAGSWLLVA
ncbi:MAG TPA: FtsW/RodA/SpoVE family cell cycle protein, partial [Pseudomonadales bacterium]|nr:FtsW/RodA/SpoVE family cell cycle protein [Pseudomonadales bacterium]